MFVNLGSLPQGYLAEAKFHSEQRHKMPFGGVDTGETDCQLILDEISKLIDLKTGDSCTFCLAEEYKQIESGLQYLADEGKTL